MAVCTSSRCRPEMKKTRNRGEKVSCCEMGWGGERADELEVVGRASLLSDSKAGVLALKQQTLAGGTVWISPTKDAEGKEKNKKRRRRAEKKITE